MKLHLVWLFMVGLLVLGLLFFLSEPLVRLYTGPDSWRDVQVSALGYSLRVPGSASVHFYQPEGILRVEVGVDQVLSVRVAGNPGDLSASAWTDSVLEDNSRRGIDPLVPMLPIQGREVITLSGLTAETFQIVGPVILSRRTVFAAGKTIFLIDQPDGDENGLDILTQIRDSFRAGFSGGDMGFEVVQARAGDDIPNLDVPYYSQTDPAWRCDQIGSCGCWYGSCAYFTGIGDAGCYITSEAMIFDYYTGHYKDPAELDACLTQNGGYGLWQGCTWGVCAASYQPISACKPKVIQYENINGNLDILDQDLRDGYPALAWVDGGTHYIVITGKKDGLYQVLDPLFPRTQLWPGQIIYFVRYHGPMPQTETPTPTITLTPTVTPTYTPTATPTPTPTHAPIFLPPGWRVFYLPFQIMSGVFKGTE